MIIGITGGTGCGKTTFLKAVEAAGGVVLDCDAIYHGLLKTEPTLLSAIDARFPGTVENGVLDRKKLGAIVFNDKAALADLNKIAHGAVKQEVMKLLTPTPQLAAIDAIGLFEGGLAELCDLTVAVTAPLEARVQRLMARDGITEDYARSRITAQRTTEEFKELCDHYLENDATAADFQEKCLAFLRSLGIMKV